MSDDAKSFWTSLPGILTGLAAVVTSVTGLFVAVNGGLGKPAHDDVAVAAVAPASASTPLQKPAAPAATNPEAQAAAVTADDLYVLSAVIEDADGFTNVRAGRGPKTDVVAVVKSNEQFHTYRQDAKWWKVKTRDGVVGYIHVSRIRVLDTPAGS